MYGYQAAEILLPLACFIKLLLLNKDRPLQVQFLLFHS